MYLAAHNVLGLRGDIHICTGGGGGGEGGRWLIRNVEQYMGLYDIFYGI